MHGMLCSAKVFPVIPQYLKSPHSSVCFGLCQSFSGLPLEMI